MSSQKKVLLLVSVKMQSDEGIIGGTTCSNFSLVPADELIMAP
jgi:hypothetical protein